MRPAIRLIAMPEETPFAPLGVLGYCLTRTDFLQPVLSAVQLPLKTVDHAPAAKLLDILVSILAGCRAIVQVNTRLCPDVALARAWGRDCFAEQSTLARTLDRFTDETVAQLRQASEALFRRESRTLHHAFTDDWLWLDIDLTPLPISKHAEGSTKGKIGVKKPLRPPTGTGPCAPVSRNALLTAVSRQTSEPDHVWSRAAGARHVSGVHRDPETPHPAALGRGLWE
jgi:hypothetical protein